MNTSIIPPFIQRSLTKAIPLLVVVLAPFVLSGQLLAIPCPINNPGFEDQPLIQPPFQSGTPPGWTGSTIGTNGDVGWYHPINTQYTPLPAATGQGMAYITANGTIFQTLSSTLAASSTFTLTGLIGHRADDAAGNWVTNGIPADAYVQLFAGVTLVATLHLLDPGENNLVPFSLTYMSPSSGPLIGQNLMILLGFSSVGDHPQVNFDNIALDCSPTTTTGVPETGMTIGLLALGLLGIISFRRALSPQRAS